MADCGSSGLALDGMEMTGPLFSNISEGHAFVLYGQHDDAPDRFNPYDDAIRDAAGWKLIQGWGGKPSDWSTSPPNMSRTAASSLVQQCTMPNCFGSDGLAADAILVTEPVDCTGAKTQNCCYPNNDIVEHGLKNATTVAECCAACAANHRCVGWTLNKQNAACFLKHKMEKPRCGGGCISGGALLPPPPPGPPPAPPLPPKDGVMLFNVVSDPGEHNDLSATNPDIVKRLSAELDKMRESAVVFNDKLTCTGPATKTTPQGMVAAPNCVPNGPDVQL